MNSDTLTRAKMVEIVHQQGLGYTKKELQDIVNSMFDIIAESVINGETVKLSGFGNFSMVDKTARVGRNPQTDEALIISRRRVITFKPSNMLRNAVSSIEDNSK
ncbi:MAG: integration host factor subunit alpha [Myxococcota bacterium]|nr:integration host factor subunit alpha [Myxococcota bacterium]MEC8379882.1 integration host factor subunit alpha [Myxococcota bacterium]